MTLPKDHPIFNESEQPEVYSRIRSLAKTKQNRRRAANPWFESHDHKIP